MENKNKYKKTLLNGLMYALASVVALTLIVGIVGGISKSNLFQGSLLSMFNSIGLTDFDEGYPDLGIEHVYVQKVSNPTDEFPYYKYQTTVVVRNYGEALDNGSVVMTSGENQKTAFVRNTLNGLDLAKGQTFIFDDYEILMDGRYNFGFFTFNVELKDQREGFNDNNDMVVSVYEEPVKLEAFAVEMVDEDENFTLSYLPSEDYKDRLDELNLDVCFAREFEGLDDSEKKYAEVEIKNDVYSYYKSRISDELILSEEFECENVDSEDNGSGNGLMSIPESFDEDVNYVVYLKASNDDDFMSVSNVLYLPTQKYVNKAEFVKLFTDFAGMEIFTDGKHYYEDVDENSWYAPYVQTMFNYGLLHDSVDFVFGPEDEVLRKDVLESLLNYFDIDLYVEDGAPHFYDVQKDNEDFFFAEALYSSGKAKALGIYLYPEKRMSHQFLKYMIDEFLET